MIEYSNENEGFFFWLFIHIYFLMLFFPFGMSSVQHWYTIRHFYSLLEQEAKAGKMKWLDVNNLNVTVCCSDFRS